MRTNRATILAAICSALIGIGVLSGPGIAANANTTITTRKVQIYKTNSAAGWRRQYGYLSYLGNETDVTVPPDVSELGAFAVNDNPYIRVLRIPQTVTKISSYAISGNPNLRYIVFEGNPVMEDNAITHCGKLTNIVTKYKEGDAQKYAGSKDILTTTEEIPGFIKKKVYLLKGDTYSQPICNEAHDGFVWSSSSDSIVSVDETGHIKAKKTGKAVITAANEEESYSYSVMVYSKSISNRVTQVKKLEITKGMSDYDKVRAVHNWMIKNISYDYKNYMKNTLPSSVYTIEGALLKRRCVCEGYAKAFKKLMDSYGIECKVVTGKTRNGGHAWNMVKLGNNWYHIDVTWDDPIVNGNSANTTVYYTYFLKSTKYIKRDHEFTVSAYPKCTSKKYDNEGIKYTN